MQKYSELGSKTWAASGKLLVSLDNLPPGKRVRAIEILCAISGTKVADTDALAADLLPQFVTNLKIGSFLNISGLDLSYLNMMEAGRMVGQGAAIAAAGATFSSEFLLTATFRNPRQPGAEDGSIPCEMLHGRSLEIQTAAAAVHGVGSLIATAGTFYVRAEIVDGSDVPQICVIGSDDQGGKDLRLEEGTYLDAFVRHPTEGTDLTSTNLASLDALIDGELIHNNATYAQLLASFNRTGITDQAAALVSGAAWFVPVIWQDQSGKGNLTKQPAVTKTGVVKCTGDQNPHLVYRKVVPKTESDIQAIAAATGAPAAASEPEVKTASKSIPRAYNRSRLGKKAKLMATTLPMKLRRSRTVSFSKRRR